MIMIENGPGFSNHELGTQVVCPIFVASIKVKKDQATSIAAVLPDVARCCQVSVALLSKYKAEGLSSAVAVGAAISGAPLMVDWFNEPWKQACLGKLGLTYGLTYGLTDVKGSIPGMQWR